MKIIEGNVIADYAFSGDQSLTEITLGPDIESIGNHAFYNCRQLITIHVPGGIKELGDGAFKNCRALEEVIIHLDEKPMTVLKQLVADISDNLEVTIKRQEETLSKLFFPKDSMQISDFTTRLYMDVTYGIGTYYRNCVDTASVDYEKYDSFLSRAKNELPEEIVLRIAVLRVSHPYQLKEHAKAQYEAYIKEKSLMALSFFMEQEQMENLEFVLRSGYVNEDTLKEVISMAQSQNKVEYAALLMNYKNQNYSKQTMSFDL